MSSRDNVKNIPTSLLQEIQSNYYRSRDGGTDYEPESVDTELYERYRTIDDKIMRRNLNEYEYEGSSI